MNKYSITNHSNGLTFEVTATSLPETYPVEWGQSARWIWLDQADAFELSREDDRRETDIGNGETRTEIHVPDDYTYDTVDITAEIALAQEEESEFSRRMDGQRVLSYLGVLINRAGYTSEQLAGIEAMPYVPETKSALIDGAFDYALYFISNITPDAVLTQQLLDAVIARIYIVMAKYPDMYP